MELEARNPTNGAWYHCIVSISSNGSPNAALRVQPVSQGTEKVCYIHDKDAVFDQLRGRSEPLSNGTCLQVEDGHKVLALLKPESGVQRFFDAQVQKVRRLRHAPTAACKCSFELRWTNAGNQARTTTVKAHVIRRLTGASVQDHQVVGEWLKSKGTSYIRETGDIDNNLQQHLEQIQRLPGSANKAQKQQATPATPEKKQESLLIFKATPSQFDDAFPEKKPSRLGPLAARAALAASLNQAETSNGETNYRDRDNLSDVVPARSSPRRIVASESQPRQLKQPVEDGTVSIMEDGNHGLCSIMDTEDRNYLEQMEAHLRLLNADVELNVFDIDSNLLSRSMGETGQMACDSNSHWKMADGEMSSDSMNSDVEPLDQGSHDWALEKLTESQQEGCQMAVAPSLSLRRELARARQLKSRVNKQPSGISDVQEPSMETPIEEREASAGEPSQDNSAVHLEPIGKQPRRSPRLAAGSSDVQEASASAKERKVSARETSQNHLLSGRQPRRSSRIAADVQEAYMKNRTLINERGAFAGGSLEDETPVLSLVPVGRLAAERDDLQEAFLKPSGMRVTPIQEREPSQDLSVEPIGLHVDLTADSLEPSTKLPEAGISVPLNGKEPAEPLEKEGTQVSNDVSNSTKPRALKTKRKRGVPIDEAQRSHPPETRVKTQSALKGKRKCIDKPPGANQVRDSAERKVETRSASKSRASIDEPYQVENLVQVKVEAHQKNSAVLKVRKREREVHIEVPIDKALKSNPEAKVEVIPGSRIKRKRGVPIHELDGIGGEDIPVAACKPAAEPALKSLRKSPRNGGFSHEAKCKATDAEASEPEAADMQTRRSSRVSAASAEDLPSSINKKRNRVQKENVKLNGDSVDTPKSGTVKKFSPLDKKNGSVGFPRRSPRFVTA